MCIIQIYVKIPWKRSLASWSSGRILAFGSGDQGSIPECEGLILCSGQDQAITFEGEMGIRTPVAFLKSKNSTTRPTWHSCFQDSLQWHLYY